MFSYINILYEINILPVAIAFLKSVSVSEMRPSITSTS